MARKQATKKVVKKATKKKAKSKVKKVALKVINGKTGEVKITKKKIIVIDNTKGSKKYENSKKEFLELRDQVRQANKDIGAKFYELGTILKRIRDNELWKYSGYKSFTKFVEQENISRQTAYNMISVAATLTRDDASSYGAAVAYVVASGHDGQAIDELKRLARAGSSAGELKMVAQEQRRIASIVSRSPGRPKKVKSSITKVNGGGQVVDETVDRKKVKKATRERLKEDYDFVGSSKIVDLKPVKAKKDTKDGWMYMAKFQLGEEGPFVQVKINTRKKLLKCKVL